MRTHPFPSPALRACLGALTVYFHWSQLSYHRAPPVPCHVGEQAVAVGMPVAQHPPHRSSRAALPHEMCSSTFHAICGRENYVALSEQLRCNEQTDWPGRHITTLAKGSSGMSSVSDPLASADLSCPHW